MNEHWIVLSYGLAAICFIVAFFILKNSKNRKPQDKVIVPQHKSLFRTPTWKFQKYHPNKCPHHNGIYRSVEIKVLDNTIKKTIFVCADCVDAIEVEEIKERDKFKR